MSRSSSGNAAGAAADAAQTKALVGAPPLQNPIVDVLAAGTPIERAHEIIDSAWAMEEQGNYAVACERYAMAVELLHCALDDMQEAANRGIVKLLAAECRGRAAAAAIAASRPDPRSKAVPGAADEAATMDQSTAILLQSFVGMNAAPAPWLVHGPGGTSTAESALPKRLQAHNILQRMNHAVEGTAASPHWLVFANAAECISSNLVAACAAGEDLDSEYISVPPPPPSPVPSSVILGQTGGGADVAKLLQTVQSLSHELACATAMSQGRLQADRALQQLRRDVRALAQALDEQLFLFAERMSSSPAAADAWLGARWNESMAASMQQSMYSYGGGGARGSPVAAGVNRESSRRDGGVSASTYFGSASSAAVGGGSESPVHELRREVQQLKAQVAELLPYKVKYEKIQATVQLDRQRQQQKQRDAAKDPRGT